MRFSLAKYIIETTAKASGDGKWITYRGRKIFIGGTSGKDNKKLTRSEQQKKWHQTGFNGQKIANHVLKDKLGYKNVSYMKHKDPVDVVTENTAWEVKTFDKRFAHHIQMGVKPKQKERKMKWAKDNKKKLKSILILVNTTAEIFVKDGVGKFRPGGMKKIASFKNWKKEIGISSRKRYSK